MKKIPHNKGFEKNYYQTKKSPFPVFLCQCAVFLNADNSAVLRRLIWASFFIKLADGFLNICSGFLY